MAPASSPETEARAAAVFALLPFAALTFVVTVYSDLPQEATKAAVAAAEHESFEFCYCEKCNGNKSPYQVIIEKMECIEAVMDERLAFLDGLLAGA